MPALQWMMHDMHAIAQQVCGQHLVDIAPSRQ